MKAYAVSCVILKWGWIGSGGKSYTYYCFAESDNDAKGKLVASLLDEHNCDDIKGLTAVEIPTDEIMENLNLSLNRKD